MYFMYFKRLKGRYTDLFPGMSYSPPYLCMLAFVYNATPPTQICIYFDSNPSFLSICLLLHHEVRLNFILLLPVSCLLVSVSSNFVLVSGLLFPEKFRGLYVESMG